jgi:hypothetical protein
VQYNIIMQLHDSWSWEEWSHPKHARHGFQGCNEKGSLTFSLDLEIASGVWYQQFQWNSGDVVGLERGKRYQRIEKGRSVTLEQMLFILPTACWPAVAELTEACFKQAQEVYAELTQQVTERIAKFEAPYSVITELDLEKQAAQLGLLQSRSQALWEIVQGEKSPDILREEIEPNASHPLMMSAGKRGVRRA